MSIATRFVGWDRPILHAVAEELRSLGPEAGTSSVVPATWDLSSVLVVLPTQRAGRRLTEILADAAQTPGARRVLVPPATTTPASLVPSLLHSSSPYATHLEQLMLWSHVLCQMAETAQQAGLRVAGEAPLTVRLRWAAIPARLHQELATAGLSGSRVASRLHPGSSLRRRWEAMGELEKAFSDALRDAGLLDPSDPAILTRSPARLQPYRTLVLGGVPTIGPALVHALRLLPQDVVALVHAPESQADGFDCDGRLREEFWARHQIDIPDSIIRPADDALGQAVRAARYVSEQCADLAADQITLCAADPSLSTPLRTVFSQSELSLHGAPGWPTDRSRPVLLLRAIESFMRRPTAAALAAILRHPDIEERILDRVDRSRLLGELDTYRRIHVPIEMSPTTYRAAPPPQALYRALRVVDRHVSELRKGTRRMSDWPSRIGGLLREIHAGPEPQTGPQARRQERDALDRVAQALEQMSMIARTAVLDQTVSGSDALGALMAVLDGDSIPEPPREQAIEMIDWAELLHDDAEAAVVLGVNDGHVPASTPDDPFLTDSLRAELGLRGSVHMRALAAYTLTAKLHSCPRIFLTFGRQSADGSPLAPSGLLFACPTDLALRRARTFLLQAHDAPSTLTPFRWSERAQILAPFPACELAPLDRLHVTAFRDYLACPYRFYLRHVLHLEAPREPTDEVDAPEFGLLLHEIASRLGREGPILSKERDEIAEYLLDCLSQLARERFPRGGSPAVAVQLAHVKARLERLATWQAMHAADGWVTTPECVEVDCEASLTIDGDEFRIHGRIDRIDHRADDDQYMILDYKSSERPVRPDASHRAGPVGAKRWMDLQLPLYRLIAPCGGARTIRLGYLNLGAEPDEAIEALADWDADVLADADHTIEHVIRCVRGRVFWPPADDPPFADDGFEPLCLDRCLERSDLLRRSAP